MMLMMKRLRITAIVALLLTALLPMAAHADVTITASSDSYVDRNDAGSNLDGNNLLVGYSNLQGNFRHTRRAYVKFDLATLTYDVDDTVKLRVHVSIAPQGTIGTVGLWSTTDGWSEDAITWSNAPTWTAQLDTKPVDTTFYDTWVEFTGAALRAFVNSQRTANGGDGVASFVIAWNACTTCTQGDDIEFSDHEGSYPPYGPPELYGPTPTSVGLTSFTGRPVPQGNLLTWETAAERDCVGFHLYRSATPQDLGARLNGLIIPATGGEQGAVYDYLDGAPAPGVVYYYRLTDVDTSGQERPHGPVTLVGWWVRLPLLACRR